VGAVVGVVVDAIQWSGTGATVSLFVITSSAETPCVTMSYGDAVPSRLKHYGLVDDEAVLVDRYVHEFDAEFIEVPSDLEAYLSTCLAEALESGGVVAWLAFEGSFDFLHLLTDDIATEIYGVGDTDGVMVVLSQEQIRSSDWLVRVRSARAMLRIDVPSGQTRPRHHAEDE
jgi:hypothetical protein